MAEHCKECNGTGKLPNNQACLTCIGSGIRPEEKPAFQPRSIGPVHTYRGMKRDFMIIMGLVALLFIINAISG